MLSTWSRCYGHAASLVWMEQSLSVTTPLQNTKPASQLKNLTTIRTAGLSGNPFFDVSYLDFEEVN